MTSYKHVPHPHILHRKAARPVKVADQFSRTSPITRFNTEVFSPSLIRSYDS
jgi:hypothetical protein